MTRVLDIEGDCECECIVLLTEREVYERPYAVLLKVEWHVLYRFLGFENVYFKSDCNQGNIRRSVRLSAFSVISLKITNIVYVMKIRCFQN